MAGNKVMGKVIKLPRVRLSFPDVFTARLSAGASEPAFGAAFLLDPKDPKHKAVLMEIKAEVDRIITEKWPKGRPPKLIVECWGKGDTAVHSETGEVYDGYEGMYFVRAKSKQTKPPLVLGKNKEHLPKDDPSVYGGVYVNATVNFWPQDNEHGKAIRCGLRGIQTLGFGDPFGSRVDESEFDDFDDEVDAGSGDDDGL